ncbi:MAG TPA: hypothetical protein PLQ12_03170 [Candidatus Defluviicoccus seviourii]|nr:hypothetical protein [Candidatus Defluviicoccus seviourii]
MRTLLAAICVIVAATVPSTAMTMSERDKDAIRNLAQILAGEQFCGLEFDQDILTKRLTSDPDGIPEGFLVALEEAMTVARFTQEHITGSHKAVHCATVKALAEKSGILKAPIE